MKKIILALTVATFASSAMSGTNIMYRQFPSFGILPGHIGGDGLHQLEDKCDGILVFAGTCYDSSPIGITLLKGLGS